jgi:phage terminase large subunit-like protein
MSQASGYRQEAISSHQAWPNGAIATTYSADEPELLRGRQHDAVTWWRIHSAPVRVLVALDQDSTIIAVIELSQSS